MFMQSEGRDTLIGSGVEAFTELSTSVLDVWLEAVSALSDSDGLSVNGREMSLSALREFLESASETDQSALDDVETIKLKKDEEDDDDEDGGVLSWLMSKGASMLLPAPIKAGLALLELVKSVGSAAVWGLLLWGGFKLVKRAASSLAEPKDGDGNSMTADWVLEPTWISDMRSGSASDSVSSAVLGVGYTERMAQGVVGEELYKRLVGEEYGDKKKGAVSTYYGVTDSWHSKAHSGLDLRIAGGTPLRWPFDEPGVIEKAYGTNNDAGGLSLIVRMKSGRRIGMAHLSSNTVLPVGAEVKRGDMIAISGNTGSHTSGAHLHITFRDESGSRVSPVTFSSDLGITASATETPQISSIYQHSSAGITIGSSLAKQTNNIANVQDFGVKWKGRTGTKVLPDGRRFVKFSSPELSLRAAYMTLLGYQDRRDISRSNGQWVTLGDVSRMYVGGNMSGRPAYAGDDIPAWASNVASYVGVRSDQPIDLRDADTATNVLLGLVKQESGTVVEPEVAKRVVTSVLRERNYGYNNQRGEVVLPNVQKF